VQGHAQLTLESITFAIIVAASSLLGRTTVALCARLGSRGVPGPLSMLTSLYWNVRNSHGVPGELDDECNGDFSPVTAETDSLHLMDTPFPVR
jgi:hypothetical protein